jgi:hypothetical protein
MSEPLDWIHEAAETGARLRNAIREVHETMRDMRQARRELEAARKSLALEVERSVGDKVDGVVDEIVDRALKGCRGAAKETASLIINDFAAVEDRIAREVTHKVLDELSADWGFVVDDNGPLGPRFGFLRRRDRM